MPVFIYSLSRKSHNTHADSSLHHFNLKFAPIEWYNGRGELQAEIWWSLHVFTRRFSFKFNYCHRTTRTCANDEDSLFRSSAAAAVWWRDRQTITVSKKFIIHECSRDSPPPTEATKILHLILLLLHRLSMQLSKAQFPTVLKACNSSG